ncbi:MAG: hypothetical protein GY749_01790 [Desulfobacteraceae bacterium]|nr:hypothetical protein [Desulfobacteraceae bacterium]
MLKLSSDLYNLCRDVMLKCDEFESDAPVPDTTEMQRIKVLENLLPIIRETTENAVLIIDDNKINRKRLVTDFSPEWHDHELTKAYR